MAITNYTSYAAIRALLGVATTEITDVVLALPHYETQFLLEMADVDQGNGTVMAQYAAAVAAAGGATADQTLLKNLVDLMAGYSVARQSLGASEMFAPHLINDGKARIQRATPQYDRLRAAINAGYNALHKRLTKVLLVLVPLAQVPQDVARNYVSNVGLGTDPVTG